MKHERDLSVSGALQVQHPAQRSINTRVMEKKEIHGKPAQELEREVGIENRNENQIEIINVPALSSQRKFV